MFSLVGSDTLVTPKSARRVQKIRQRTIESVTGLVASSRLPCCAANLSRRLFAMMKKLRFALG